MRLTYRGASYEYNPSPVETAEGQVGGKYRGLDWRFRNLKKEPILQPRVNLTYRGVTYQVHPQAGDSTVKPQVRPSSTEDRARALMMGHTRAIKKRQQSILSRVAAEIGLNSDEVANYWNHIQGKVHPTFRSTYDRHGNRAAS